MSRLEKMQKLVLTGSQTTIQDILEFQEEFKLDNSTLLEKIRLSLNNSKVECERCGRFTPQVMAPGFGVCYHCSHDNSRLTRIE